MTNSTSITNVNACNLSGRTVLSCTSPVFERERTIELLIVIPLFLLSCAQLTAVRLEFAKAGYDGSLWWFTAASQTSTAVSAQLQNKRRVLICTFFAWLCFIGQALDPSLQCCWPLAFKTLVATLGGVSGALFVYAAVTIAIRALLLGLMNQLRKEPPTYMDKALMSVLLIGATAAVFDAFAFMGSSYLAAIGLVTWLYVDSILIWALASVLAAAAVPLLTAINESIQASGPGSATAAGAQSRQLLISARRKIRIMLLCAALVFLLGILQLLFGKPWIIGPQQQIMEAERNYYDRPYDASYPSSIAAGYLTLTVLIYYSWTPLQLGTACQRPVWWWLPFDCCRCMRRDRYKVVPAAAGPSSRPELTAVPSVRIEVKAQSPISPTQRAAQPMPPQSTAASNPAAAAPSVSVT